MKSVSELRQSAMKALSASRKAIKGEVLFDKVFKRGVMLAVNRKQQLIRTLLNGDDRFVSLPHNRWFINKDVVLGKVPTIDKTTFVVIDVETAGMVPSCGAITEISAVRVKRGKIGKSVSQLVNPGQSISWQVSDITGITDEMVQGEPPFGEVCDKILKFIGKSVFVAHNASFDWQCLSDEVAKAKGAVLPNDTLCTVKLARAMLPNMRRYSLDALAQYFQIKNPSRHRAHGDAVTTARILLILLEMAKDKGIWRVERLPGFARVGK